MDTTVNTHTLATREAGESALARHLSFRINSSGGVEFLEWTKVDDEDVATVRSVQPASAWCQQLWRHAVATQRTVIENRERIEGLKSQLLELGQELASHDGDRLEAGNAVLEIARGL